MAEKEKDRISQYLVPKLDRYLFGELPDEVLRETGTEDFMQNVPFPVEKTHLTDESLNAITIARNMAYVFGADPNFKYREAYCSFIRTLFSVSFVRPLIREGAEAAEKEDFETACIFARAALVLDPQNRDALILYGQATHDAYETKSEEANSSLMDEEYIGNFKAESMEIFERLTVLYPDVDPAYYYLGYAYLNLGLYNKARLTFLQFLSLTTDEERKKEVRDLMGELKDPCILEEGINQVVSGRPEAGIDILSEYEKHPKYQSWWPLWYYLGVARRSIGCTEDAVRSFKEALKNSPSNTDVMQELVSIYEEVGDAVNVEKYRKKIGIVQQNRELDREQRRRESGMTVS